MEIRKPSDTIGSAEEPLVDIRALERAQEQLRRAEAQFTALVEHIPAVLWMDLPDDHQTPVYVSPQVESLLGVTPAEYLADPNLWDKLLHPDDRERAIHEYVDAIQGADRFTSEYRMVARDGRILWIRNETEILRDETGSPTLVQGVMFDITDRKRAEAELEAALELEREATERLRAVDDMKNTFLQAVSHELRTPLTSVLGIALTLQRRDEVRLAPFEVDDLLNRLVGNARKLELLLSDLLDLDRLARGIVEPRLRPTELSAVLRRLAGDWTAAEHPIEVDADPAFAMVEAAKVELIVENLLANAVKHTPAGTTIWVRLIPVDDAVVIAVDDDGPGIPESLRGTIFEPFQQGPDTPQYSPGVGIGLSLVAGFARMHGGRAWVEDRPGGGSSFRVLIPTGL
jgi:PAS domain S-box-containing protein